MVKISFMKNFVPPPPPQIISRILDEIEKHLEREEPETMETSTGSAGGEKSEAGKPGDGGVAKEEKGTSEEQEAEKVGDDEQLKKIPK